MNLKRTHQYVTAIILFSGAGLLARPLCAQLANATFTPGVQHQHSFTCHNNAGIPTEGCQITLTVTAIPQTNAHFHEGPAGLPTPAHPVSGLCASGGCSATNPPTSSVSGFSGKDGTFYFTIATTLVGQLEKLTGTSTNSTPLGDWVYQVGYSDLYSRQGDPRFIPIGGSETGANTGHGTTANNQYMTQATYDALVATVTKWAATGNCKICTNDCALPAGGKFDIRATTPYDGTVNYPHVPGYYPYFPWASPHAEHDRGTAVDIAANPRTCKYPVNVNRFLAMCTEHGLFDAARSFPEGNHVHCGLAVTFPHVSCDSNLVCH